MDNAPAVRSNPNETIPNIEAMTCSLRSDKVEKALSKATGITPMRSDPGGVAGKRTA